MPNGYEVVWSPRAKSDLENKLKWLEENWSEREIRQFAKALNERIQLIIQNPNLFPKTRKKSGIHKSVMKFHTVLYYRVTRKEIQILTLFDPRQHPEKLSLLGG
jgi:plasmid stabilization system protein ParE